MSDLLVIDWGVESFGSDDKINRNQLGLLKLAPVVEGNPYNLIIMANERFGTRQIECVAFRTAK